MTDSIIEPKKVDGFTHESPIRAFTDFKVNGKYAIGKGFRPSLAHLGAYLDAMHTKEGWAFAQIILPRDNDGEPTILFWKSTYNPVMPELREPAPAEPIPTIKPGEVLGVNKIWRGDVLVYDREQDGDEQWTIHGSDADIPVRFHEQALRFIADKRGIDGDKLVRDFMLYFKERNQPNQVSHKMFAAQLGFILNRAKPHELKALIDQFRLSMSPKDHVVKPPMTSAVMSNVGEGPIPELVYWNGEAGNFYGMVSRRGQGQEFMDTWYPRRAEFPTSPADEPVFDEANPKHYGGWECGDIGERLSANGYQILKYCWRLGKKDDACIELGKAYRYAERERDLLISMERTDTDKAMKPFTRDLKDPTEFLEDRIDGQSDFTKSIARMLWSGYNQRKLRCIMEVISEQKFHMECGSGLAI